MKVLKETNSPSISMPKKNLSENHFSIKSLEILKRKLHELPELQPQPPSFFSRIANFWGGFSWWYKAFILFILITPIIVTAVYFQIPLIFTGVGAVAGIYISLSLLLDNQHYTEKRIYQEFEQKFSQLFQCVEGELGRIWSLGSSMFFELGSTTSKNQEFQTQAQSSSLETSQLNQQVLTLNEKISTLTQLNRSLENTNSQLQQQIQAISSANNDRFLSTLIAHMNQGQYVPNPYFMGAPQMQFGPNPNQVSMMQRNFFNESNGVPNSNQPSASVIRLTNG